MFPIICKIGPITIYSYGLMLAVAVIVCSALLSRDAKSFGLKSDQIFDVVFWSVIGGLVGARLFYIFLNWHFFKEYPLEMIMVQKGGLAWQGALILGTLSGLLYVYLKKLPLLLVLDLCAPYIALGHSIGRIGCFLNGCCYGRPVSWGIYFPLHEARLHPTQLYDSAGLLLIFLVLKKYQGRVKWQGCVFALYMILASGLRFGVEYFRADHAILIWGMSLFQVVSLVLAGGGAALFIFLKAKYRTRKETY